MYAWACRSFDVVHPVRTAPRIANPSPNILVLFQFTYCIVREVSSIVNEINNQVKVIDTITVHHLLHHSQSSLQNPK